jgi:signal transduction histidine kinase/ligand-binding sensor domain-containing protein
VLLVFFAFSIFGQSSSEIKEAGNPLGELHTSKEYNAHGQNFSVVQDKRGIMYFGNFAGTLEYDGTNWRTIPTKEVTKVSALHLDEKTGKIFVGGNGEFGYLKPDARGTLYFESLSEKIKINFGEIISIVQTNAGIYFVGKNNMYLWKDQLVKEWYTEDPILSAYKVNDQIYFYQKVKGITTFDGKATRPVRKDARLPDLFAIAAFLPFDEETALVVTTNQGVLKLSNNRLEPFSCSATTYLVTNQVSTGLRLFDGNFALATIQGGLIVMNPKGEIIQLSQGENFDNVQINSMYQSEGGILWLALNNGIYQVDIPSPFSVFNEGVNINGEVNDLHRYQNRMYVATLNGLYYMDGFIARAISGINASCFSLSEGPNSLLVATGKGVFGVNGAMASLLTSDFSISLHTLRSNTNIVFIGLESGLGILNVSTNSYRKVAGLDDQITGITESDDGVIWLETLSKGLYKTDQNVSYLKVYEKGEGLETVYYNQVLNSSKGLIAWNKNGIFRYQPSKDRFEKYNIFQTESTAGAYWKGEIIEDKKGDFWTTRGDEKVITLYRKTAKGAFKKIEQPFRAFSDRTFKVIYPDSDSIVWFGGPDGAIRLDLRKGDDYKKQYPALIRKINFKSDSLRFDGYFEGGITVKSSVINPAGVVVNHDLNDISFSFSAASYNVDEELTFRYYLENFDDTWSDWTPQNQKEYTNLAPGRYVFRVMARNIYEIESEESIFEFLIETPWYRMWWAYILYVLLLGVVLFYIVRWRLGALVKEKDQLESMIAERTEEIFIQKEYLEIQSKEVASKNEQLEKIDQIVQSINSEIDFKSLFETVLAQLNIIRNMDTATALIYDKESNSFLFNASFGVLDMSALENVQLTLQQAEERYLENAEEKAEDIYFKSDAKFMLLGNSLDQILTPKSLITIVINVEGKVEGFITIQNSNRANAFDEKDFDIIRNLKEHLIAAFIKTRILANLEKTLDNLKLAQEELIRQERLASVGSLTRGIVDRILNPLNYINNFSESSYDLIEEIIEVVKEEDVVFPENAADNFFDDMDMLKLNLVKIKEHGESTTRIVKDMQRLLKEKSTEFFETELNVFLECKIKTAIQELRSTDKGNDLDLDIVFALEAQSAKVKILPYELSSVIINLVNNSYYSMAEKQKTVKGYAPMLITSTETKGSMVVVRFRDNGKGIPKKEMEQMFSPFFTTKPTSKGTGLGLYMSKDIIETHKGEISIESKEGEYFELTIRLPIK